MAGKQSQVFVVLIIFIVTASLMAAMAVFRPQTPLEVQVEQAEKIEGVTALRIDVFPTVSTQAVVESRVKIALKSQVSGRIVSTSPRFLTGGAFQVGDVILEIDPSDYQLRLVQAEVDVARAEQELRTEKELADLALKDWKKYSKGAATDLVLRLPQLREAEASLKGAKANYEIQRLQLSRTKIVAPFPLMIDSKLADLGQVISNNQDVVVVFGTEEAEVRMPLSQSQVDLLNISKVGVLSENDVLKVNIRDRSRTGKPLWEAKILRVEGSIDRKSRVYYAVATILDPMNLNQVNTKLPLLAGVFVDVEVLGPKIENVFRVPTKAMRDDHNVYVYESGSLITKPVVVVDFDDQYVTIVSGIEEGEIVCISPPWSYVRGMKATLVNLDGVPFNGVPSKGTLPRITENKEKKSPQGNKLVTNTEPSVVFSGKKQLVKTGGNNGVDKPEATVAKNAGTRSIDP